MCGRYFFNGLPVSDFPDFRIEISEIQDFPAGEVFPSQNVPIFREQDEHNEICMMQWGMYPDWSKSLLINARKENLLSSKFWSPSAHSRRCLIPASGFFEWQTVNGQKIKWEIRLKGSDFFCFAGIFDLIKDRKKGSNILSCVILTEPANPLMRHIHNHGDNKHRQPVIIPQEQYSLWLDGSRPADKVLESIGTYSEDILDAAPEKDGLF